MAKAIQDTLQQSIAASAQPVIPIVSQLSFQDQARIAPLCFGSRILCKWRGHLLVALHTVDNMPYFRLNLMLRRSRQLLRKPEQRLRQYQHSPLSMCLRSLMLSMRRQYRQPQRGCLLGLHKQWPECQKANSKRLSPILSRPDDWESVSRQRHDSISRLLAFRTWDTSPLDQRSAHRNFCKTWFFVSLCPVDGSPRKDRACPRSVLLRFSAARHKKQGYGNPLFVSWTGL